MKKWILNLLIVVFMIAFSGNVYALDTDYKVNNQTYSTLEEAVEAINIGNEDEYVLMIPDKEETLNLDGLQKSITIKREKLVNQESSSLKEIVVSNSTENQIEVKLEKISPTKANLTNTKLVLGDTNDALEIDKSSTNFSVDTGDGQDTVTYPFSSLDTTNVINCEKFISTSDTLNVKGNKEINKDEQTGNVVIDQMYFTQLTKLIVEGQNIEVTLNTPISEIDLGGNKAIVNNDETMTIKNGNVVVNTAVDKVYQNNMLNNLSLEEISNLEIKSGKLNVKDLNAVVEKENDQSSVTLSNSTMKIIYAGTQLLLNDTEITYTIQNQELEYTIPYQNADISINNDLVSIINKDNQNQKIQFKINGLQKLILKGNEFDNTYTFSMNTSVGLKVTINGELGNDTLNIVNQLEGSSISLEIDMENVNLMNSDSTNKSVHVNSLGFGGTTSNIDSTGFDYNVSGIFNIDLSYRVDNTMNPNIKEHVSLRNGQIQANEIKINALANANISHETNSVGLANVKMNMGVELILENMRLISQAGITIKAGIEVDAQVSTGTGTSHLAVITSYADLKASITIKNSTLEAHGAVSIESENTFNSTMVSTGNHGEGQSKDSGGYVVFNIFKQNADVYVQAKITTPQDLTIRSNVITNHSLSSTVAQDGASGTDAAKTLQTLLEELKGKVDNNDIVNKLSDLLISVLGTANSIDSTLSSTKIRLLGQQVGAGVFNYGTINNKAQFLAQEGTNIRNLKILADRTTTTNIQVDGSAVSEQGYFSSKGYGAGFGLNYLHIDQLASLMENSSLAAHALNILSNGQNEYILNVKAGYVKEGFGTGGAIAGQYIYLKNESLMNTKNPIQLSSAMAVKAIENSTMKMNCGTQEGETKTVGSSIGLVFFIDQVKAYVNKSTLGDLTQLEVIAESDLNSQLNLRAGGNGGTSVAPAYAIHTVLSNVVAQMDADVSTNGSVYLLAKSDKYVDTEVISDLMAECPGKGTSIALNVVSGYLRSLLNGNVNARDVKVNTYHVLRSDVYTLASPDGSTDEDDRTTLEKLKPNNLYNKAKESIQSSLNQFKETISNFNIMDALFEVSFDTTEGEVQKAGTLAIQLFKGDALAQVNGTINASGNVKIISEGAMNSFVLSSANTGEGTSKASGMSMAVIAGSYQNYAIMSGNIQHASSLTIESKGMATNKKDEGGEIITNDVNTFYINSLSGATSDGKTTAGAVTLVYLKQDYQAILEGNAIVDNNITVNSIIKEKIISNALSQASHNFGISIGWKNKVKGTGIGVVINFIDTSSKAIIGGKNNSINIKANSIDVKSIYQTDIKAKAEIGGEGKTTTAMATLDAGVLVNIINPVIYAKIDNVNLDVSNEVNVQGEYSGSTSGEVSAEAVSNGKSKGGAVTVLYIESDIQSYVNASGTIQGALNVEALANVYNTIDAEASAEGALLGDYASVLNIDLKQELKSQIKGKSTPLSSLAGKLAGKLGNNPGTSLSSGLLTKKDISTPDQATQEKGKTQKGKEVSIAAAVAYMNLKHGVYASVVGNNLNVGSLKVEASNHSNYKIKAVGNSESNGKSASLGIGLILSENRTQASLGGILTSNGNIDINSIYMQNYDPNYINDLAIEVYTTAKAKSDKGTKQSNAITVSGAGVYLESNDQTTAKIDSNATIKASNISINALEKSKYAIRAWAFDKSEENNSKGVGIAFAMLNINGSVLSYVDDGSSIIANDLSLSSLKLDVDEQKFELNLDFSGFKGDIENLNLEGLKDNVINNLLKFTKVFSMHNYYIDVIGGGSTENGGLVATGSAGVLTFKDKMKSYIGKDVTLNLSGKLTLNANNDTSILMISGALSKGGKASIGLNTLVYINENEVSTYIDERSTINASSTEMKSSDNKSLMLLSLTGALDGDKVALGGAVNTILSQNKVSTEIKEGVQLTTKGDISLISENDLKGKNLMFNIEDSNTAAVGASVAYIDILNKTYTNIGNNVVIKGQVDYAGYLLLKALATENLMSILFGAGNSDKAAINASVAYKNITSDTRATIGNGSTIKVSHLDMLAEDHTKMMGVIGGITISKKVGIGGASDVNEFNKKVYAHIGNSKVNVKYNLTAKVNSEDYILSIVVGLGGGSNAAVTGSVPVTTIKNDLDAHIDSDEDILVGGDLVVEATQNDTLIIYAGAISGSKTAAVGLSATNVIISGQIKAYLDVKNLKTNSVTILTNKKDKFSFGSVAGSVSGSISVTGAELTILVNTVMSSYIGDDSNLSITKSLTIKANHEIDSTSSTGQLAGASTTAIGAGVLVYKLELTVNSYVGNNVTVLNELEGPIIIVADSKNKLLFVVVGVTASGTTSVNGNAATILITNKVNAFVGNSSTLQTNGNMLIYANDQQDLNADLGSAAVAGTAGINVSALVIILKSETKSSIGDATKIIVRGNGEGISYNGKTYTGLNVLAQSTQNIQGVAITAAGGTAAVNPNALVMILNNKVIASIGTGAVITCGADVSIQALSTISLDATVGGATGGQAAVNPGVIYISSNKTIQALINGTINANNMDVLSSSKATFRGVLAGASFGEVAVNAITLVLIIDDTIEAKADTASSLIGNKVQVKAYNYVNNAIASASVSGGLAAVGAQATVLKMTSNVHASVYHVCANTLNVIADSNEQLTVYATGASGGLVGVAGSVTVVILKNNMSAGILANAEVNANNVNVQTNDRLTLDALAGSVSAGAVGVGAAVNVIIIRNTTHSFIGENVVINGNSQNNALRVSATTDVTRIINAKAVSGAAAGVAGSTSILVINIGKAFDNDMNKALSDSENNTNRIEGIQESLNASKNNLRLDSKYMSLDQLDVNILGDIQSTDSTIEDANSATVGQGATINTNDFILIARDNTQLDAICGSAGVGLASVGGAVSVITIGNNVFALFDGTVNATNSIQIQAISDQSTYKVSSISGGAGYVGSLGANVAILNIKSQVKALLQSHAQLNGFKSLSILAKYANDSGDMIQIIVGSTNASLGLSAGATVLTVKNNANVAVEFADNANIDASQGDIDVEAYTKNGMNIKGYSTAGGIVSGDALVLVIVTSSQSSTLIGGLYISAKSLKVRNKVMQPITITVGQANVGGATAGALALTVTNNVQIENKLFGTITTSGDITLITLYNSDANGNKLHDTTINATTLSGGFVGGTGIGENITDNSVIKNTLSGTINAKDIQSLIAAYLQIVVSNVGGNAGVYSGSVKVIILNIQSTITNKIADNAKINANTVDLTNLIRTFEKVSITGVSFGSVNVGVTSITATINPTLTVQVGENAEVKAQDIRLKNWYNTNPVSSSNSKPSSLENVGIEIHTTSMSGALVGAQGTITIINHNTKVQTIINRNGKLIAGNSIEIINYGSFDAKSDYNSLQVGFVSIGANVIEVNLSGTVSLVMQESSELSAGGDVSLITLGYGHLVLNTSQASGGLISGGENSITLKGTYTIKTELNNSVKIISTNGTITLLTTGYVDVNAKVEGKSLSGISVGASQFTNSNKTEVSIVTGKGVQLQTAGDLVINVYYLGSYDITLITSAGALVGAIANKLVLNDSSDVVITIGINNILKGKTIDISTLKAYDHITVNVEGVINGIITLGRSELNATIGGHVETNIQSGTQITSTSDMTIASYVDFEGISLRNYAGTEVALASNSKAASYLTITGQPRTIFGNNVILNSNGNVNIIARIENIKAELYTESPVVKEFAGSNTVSAEMTLNLAIFVDLGDHISITASRDLNIITAVKALDLYVYSYSKVYAADTTTKASSTINIQNVQIEIIGKNAKLSAYGKLNIQALTGEDIKVHTYAFSEIGAGVTGKVYANSIVNLSIVSRISLTGTGEYSGKDIYIYAQAPIENTQNFNRETHCESKTVVNYVHKAITKVIEVVEKVTQKITKWLPWPLNHLVKWIVKTVTKLVTIVEDIIVKEILGSEVKENVSGSFTSSSDIYLEGTLSYGTSTGIHITIDENEKITGPDGLQYRKDGNNIYLDQLGSLSSGTCKIISATGTLRGKLVIKKKATLSDITIENNSSYNIYIGDLDLTNSSNIENADYLIQCYEERNGLKSDYKITEEFDGTVAQTVISITSSKENSNIYFNGKIHLANAKLVIDTKGNTYTTSQAELIVGSMYATFKDMGSKDQLFNVFFTSQDGTNEEARLSLRGSNAYLVAELYNIVDNLEQDNTTELVLIIEQFVITGNCEYTIPSATISDGFSSEDVTYVEGQGDESKTYKVVKLDENGKPVLDKNGNYVYEGEITIDNKSNSTNSTIKNVSVVIRFIGTNEAENFVLNDISTDTQTRIVFEKDSTIKANTVTININGSIQSSNDTTYDILANKAYLHAKQEIKDLRLDVSKLEATTDKTITLINNVDRNVTVNLEAKEDINVTLGNTVIEKIYTDGNIDLNAKDVAVQNYKLHIKANKLTANVNTFGTSEHKVQT
ncbi:glycosyltransferase family protein, partial [Faecalibacillus faecis]